MTSLDGRTALITGVSGGIGTALAATFAREGAAVIGTYRQRRAEAETAVPGGLAQLLDADLSDAGAARDLWRRARAAASIDTLVVNAATLVPTALDADDEDWDDGWQRSLQTNVVAASTLMRAAAADFAERGSGSIIAISSWAAQQGSRLPDLGAYAASKAALRNFAQTLARATARDGVRVYTLAPGPVGTGMGTVDRDDDEIRAVADGLAMGRHVDAQEIAELAAFLASDRCPSLTGSTLDLNGASYIR
ncbi:3-oxoacyl-[acyl-carrier-protein] reductase FabG [Microbacterium lemovicicum]|uniref:3-oxoacyl-[acyl-carrier-protein] reductase FabG n=1 Tax=Microbacterium lemovicicum TaxID=1072463 RepID=A0A3S9WCM6_9MICO|nr:SDR family oxidoreductase [Microbacterium lemovicicum]AZS37816.1 3-oxoacyl-[acyl-carrier-protein] reductase FabG [Microbacterium lemovicicum]